jgi:hypothetical protein
MLTSRRGEEAVSPDKVGYLAGLSGREEASATLLRTELEDGANASLETKTKTEITLNNYDLLLIQLKKESCKVLNNYAI